MSSNVIEVVNDMVELRGEVDLDLVRVRIEPGCEKDALSLDCQGVIRRLEIETWMRDAIKLHRPAHDLHVGGGFVICHDKIGRRKDSVHQNCLHVMGGQRVTFEDVQFLLDTDAGEAWPIFINDPGPEAEPTVIEDVIFRRCFIRGQAERGWPVQQFRSLRTGFEGCVVVRSDDGRALRVGDTAVDPVDLDNLKMAREDYFGDPPRPVWPPRILGAHRETQVSLEWAIEDFTGDTRLLATVENETGEQLGAWEVDNDGGFEDDQVPTDFRGLRRYRVSSLDGRTASELYDVSL